MTLTKGSGSVGLRSHAKVKGGSRLARKALSSSSKSSAKVLRNRSSYTLSSREAKQVLRASTEEPGTETSDWQNWAPADDSGADGEVYEVNLPKPIGVSFARGNDGMTYITAVNPRKGSVDGQITPGDKLLRVSASFGDETWEALNYGQIMYAIRTRAGDVYLQLLKRGGDMTIFEKKEMDETTKMFQNERAGGNYGYGTQELQQRNYIAKMEEARKRRELFDDGLEKFQAKDYEGALVDWENVLGMEPLNYMSDNFAMVSQVYKVSAFNIACCYAQMNQVDAGLEAWWN